MNINDIEKLFFNPFWGSTLIPHFLSGCPKNEIQTELLYLLFPFVFHEDSRKILMKSNGKSTIYSAFLGKPEGKIALAGIETRFSYFKKLTSDSLIVASSNENLIEVDAFIKAKKNSDYTQEPDFLIKDYYKASKYLGVIFSKEEFLDIFVKLGIREL